MGYLEHENNVKNYVNEFHPDWNIDKRLSNGENVEICENGDVHYNMFIIIKTGIRLTDDC
jgi:hypothetical protein